MLCYLCKEESIKTWTGYFCSNCTHLQDIGKCYGFKRIHDIINTCCVRDESQLERKMKLDKKKKLYSKVVVAGDEAPITRSKLKVTSD